MMLEAFWCSSTILLVMAACLFVVRVTFDHAGNCSSVTRKENMLRVFAFFKPSSREKNMFLGTQSIDRSLSKMVTACQLAST